MLGKACSD